MVIREATAADEAAVVALWVACGLDVPTNDPGDDFRFALEGAASTILVGTEADVALVGAVMVGHDGHRGWVYYVATAPTHRRRGIGRALLAAAERWLIARRVPKMQLMIRDANAEVADFYERLGFEQAPRIFMQKWLRADQS